MSVPTLTGERTGDGFTAGGGKRMDLPAGSGNTALLDRVWSSIVAGGSHIVLTRHKDSTSRAF